MIRLLFVIATIIYQHHKSFPDTGNTRDLLNYTTVSHTRALRCNKIYANNHAASIEGPEDMEPTQEEIDIINFGV